MFGHFDVPEVPDGAVGGFAVEGAFVVADVVGVFAVLVVAALAAAMPPNRSAPATADPAMTLRMGFMNHHLLRCCQWFVSTAKSSTLGTHPGQAPK
ncbi:MAG TPA: hypothetical protein VGI86_06340 [Acidimicrobiia bacterium]|jgi:hypothetical protein